MKEIYGSLKVRLKNGELREPPKNTAFNAVMWPQLVRFCRRGVSIDQRIFCERKFSEPTLEAAPARLVVKVMLGAVSSRLRVTFNWSLIIKSLMLLRVSVWTIGAVVGESLLCTTRTWKLLVMPLT